MGTIFFAIETASIHFFHFPQKFMTHFNIMLYNDTSKSHSAVFDLYLLYSLLAQAHHGVPPPPPIIGESTWLGAPLVIVILLNYPFWWMVNLKTVDSQLGLSTLAPIRILF